MQRSEDDRSSVDLDDGTVLIEADEFEQEADDDAEDLCISQTLQGIYENLKRQKRVDYTHDISSSDRRLDALAKILEVYSGSTCIAVCVINNSITVASNDLCVKSRGVGGSTTTVAEGRINEVYGYFRDIARTGIISSDQERKVIFENLCKKAKYQSTNTPFYDVLEQSERDQLINAIMQPRNPGSQDLFRSMGQHADFVAAKGNWLVLYRAFRKLERELSKTRSDPSHDKISDEYFAAFQNDLVILREEQKVGVHAEAQLIASLLRQTRTQQAQTQRNYIGNGKLCCLHCRIMVETTNTKMRSTAGLEEFSITVRGRHDIDFGTKWISPISIHNILLQDIIKETKKHVKEVLDNAENGYHAVMHPNVSQSAHTSSPVSSSGQADLSAEPESVVQILLGSLFVSDALLSEDEKRLMPLLVHLLQNPGFSDFFNTSISITEDSVRGVLSQAKDASIFSDSLEEDFIKILKNSKLIGVLKVVDFKSITDKLEQELENTRQLKRQRP